MVTLIHGDDTTASRNLFYEKKTESKDPIVFDNNSINLTDFLQSLSGKSLFTENKKIFLDGVFSSKKIGADELKEFISVINKSHSPIEIFIWEGSELSKTFLNQFPKPNIKFFKLPQNLFTFLDGIKPNSPHNISLFHSALKNSDENFIFSMIIRQFRLLLALRGGQNDSIDELQRLGSWQIEKLQRQSKLFTIEQLKRIYNKLYELDLDIKTGVRSNLTAAIDIFLLNL